MISVGSHEPLLQTQHEKGTFQLCTINIVFRLLFVASLTLFIKNIQHYSMKDLQTPELTVSAGGDTSEKGEDWLNNLPGLFLDLYQGYYQALEKYAEIHEVNMIQVNDEPRKELNKVLIELEGYRYMTRFALPVDKVEDKNSKEFGDLKKKVLEEWETKILTPLKNADSPTGTDKQGYTKFLKDNQIETKVNDLLKKYFGPQDMKDKYYDVHKVEPAMKGTPPQNMNSKPMKDFLDKKVGQDGITQADVNAIMIFPDATPNKQSKWNKQLLDQYKIKLDELIAKAVAMLVDMPPRMFEIYHGNNSINPSDPFKKSSSEIAFGFQEQKP